MTAPSPRRTRGFTYLGLLLFIALLSASLGMAGELWRTRSQREKEDDLLFAGRQFRAAIQSYLDAAPAGQPHRLPMALQELVEDKRWPLTRRHLRRIYIDPMTGTSDWLLIKGAGGGIQGVRSQSDARPFKHAGFDADEASFETAQRVSDWEFSLSAINNGERASPRK